jgi:hypothetical protein|tara:strand:- start:651 stop:842 length:192 start_codon:yes stop_codon:yes gene_type:complete
MTKKYLNLIDIDIEDLEFWLGDMNKENILKEVLIPIINGEYKPSQVKQDILNTLQETDSMELR